jgi:hypothetical protein
VRRGGESETEMEKGKEGRKERRRRERGGIAERGVVNKFMMAFKNNILLTPFLALSFPFFSSLSFFYPFPHPLFLAILG